MLRRRFVGLWRHADFMRLWTGQTISAFGSLVGATAIAFTAILVLHATPFQLGMLAVFRLAPGFLTGLIAGAWVDRLRRRPILIGADIGRAMLLATIPTAAILRHLRIEQLYVITFLVGILSIFFDVAYESYLPSLIGRDQLIEGNSKLSSSASVAELSGLGVAGWLVQLFTAPVTILIDAVSFFVSAISIWVVRAPEPAAVAEVQPNMLREIIEGLRFTLHHTVLRATAACTLSKEFFGGIYGALVMLYMVRDLGFAAGILGSIWAVGGLSSLAGAVSAGSMTRRLGIGPAMIAGLILYSIAMLFIPLAQGATLAAALLLIGQQVLGDGAATLYQVNQVSLRQAITPARLLGRVNATAEFLRLGAALVGSLLGGLMGNTIGVRKTLVVGSLGSLLSTLWLAVSPIRALRTAPALLAEPIADDA
jgi:MFS family permease